jgi:alpha-L-rhamnosidase
VITNPWQTYNTYGDTDILHDMYPIMESLLSFYANATQDDGLLHAWGESEWLFLGDWITPHGSESNYRSPENILFNNAYLHYITKLTAKISSVLGFEGKAQKYHAAAQKLAAAVTAKFANSDGVYLDMLQTHSAMPLASGLVPVALANKTMANLAHAITVINKGHLDTGLTGTYFMTKMLMESGRNDLIFTYANQTTFPSYGYFLEQGYTTWPEDWNARSGVSKMHGCYNAIGVWFVEGIAGIRVHVSEEPPLTIRAGVDAGDISWANGNRAAPHGQVRSSWALATNGFLHNISIPGNAKAKVLIPSSDGAAGVTEGGLPVATAKGVSVVGQKTINHVHYVVLIVLSGDYHFASSWTRGGVALALAA